MDYNIAWYVLVGILLIGYSILDGFDLGVGIVHLWAKGDTQRRLVMNSIGPVWDGNEVWLITAGGALFAAFPEVYATGFSTFYLPFMMLLMALIFRAVSMEFRSKESSRRWRNAWDFGFSAGSTLAAFLFGIAIGNVILGLPIGADKEFAGTLSTLIRPYTLLIGLLTVVMFAMHGSLYLIIKSEGELQIKAKTWAQRSYYLFLVLYILATFFTLRLKPEMIANFSFGYYQDPGSTHEFIASYPILISVVTWMVVLLNILAIANVPRCIKKQKEMQGFVSSACTIAALISLFALGIFPKMIPSTLNGAFSLDIYNASSSNYTLKTMFGLALIGMPFVLAYTSIIYWTYRGKTVLTDSSY
ncbi:MAG: cytochrome d ubiquinol oxidase subunit II [Bacteroidota bacterium]